MSRAKTDSPHAHVYSTEFYDRQKDGSFRSAQRVLPHLLELTSPRSIVDVGCGVGTWLAAALGMGIHDVLGLDGPYVDRQLLRIPQDRFLTVDLTQPVRVHRTAMWHSVEVGEHPRIERWRPCRVAYAPRSGRVVLRGSSSKAASITLTSNGTWGFDCSVA